MSDEPRKAEPGDVVQVDPTSTRFGPVFVIVEEVRSWGVLGYFLAHGEEGVGAAYVRVKHGDYVRIGRAEWAVGKAPGEEDAARAEKSS